MNWQLLIVSIIVALCAYMAFRQIKRELSGQSKCSGCAEAKKSQNPIRISPQLKR